MVSLQLWGSRVPGMRGEQAQWLLWAFSRLTGGHTWELGLMGTHLGDRPRENLGDGRQSPRGSELACRGPGQGP